MRRLPKSNSPTKKQLIYRKVPSLSRLKHYSLRSKTSISRRYSDAFTIVELLIVIVVIAILAAITIVAYNGIQERAKASSLASELAQWKKKAQLHMVDKGIECPDGFIFVYGNPTLGTNDFCVMKYEARNAGSNVPVSQPTGTPWVSISQTNAIAYAPNTANCSNCKLISDPEWMTIAADVLSVKHNWSGGEIGSGFIYSGHNDSSPYSAVTASASDTDYYSGTGNSKSSGENQRRVLYLTSGEAIWDFAGNVWERTNATISGGQPGLSGESAYTWKQWNNGSLLMNTLPTTSRPATIGVGSYSATQGIGQLYSNYGESATRAFLRGGNWSNGSGAGVLTLDLFLAPSYASTDIGFRVASGILY